MAIGLKSSRSWILFLAGAVLMGVLSRVVHTGLVVFDKYLGDALYAAMVYAILRLVWRSRSVALPATVVMIGIELFQLTRIPAHMLESRHLMIRVCARLIGTEFSYLDLIAYGAGIVFVCLADSTRVQA